jgi:hypothetical protein
VHPILAAFVGDYPEQVLVTGVKYTECPKCTVSPKELGKKDATSTPRNMLDIHAALLPVNGNLKDYKAVCKAAGIKPIYLFWAKLPYADICYNTVRTPTLCKPDTSDRSYYFLPTFLI